jgi:hypothetical protein
LSRTTEAAGDAGAKDLIGAAALAVNHRSARHECGGSVNNVEDIGLLFVDLGTSGFNAPARLDAITTRIYQVAWLGESFRELLAPNIGTDWADAGSVRIHAANTPSPIWNKRMSCSPPSVRGDAGEFIRDYLQRDERC